MAFKYFKHICCCRGLGNMDCDICYETYYHEHNMFFSKRCTHTWCIDCHKQMIRSYGRNFACPYCRVPIRKAKQKNPYVIEAIEYEFMHEYELDTCYCNITKSIRPWRVRKSVLKCIRNKRTSN